MRRQGDESTITSIFVKGSYCNNVLRLPQNTGYLPLFYIISVEKLDIELRGLTTHRYSLSVVVIENQVILAEESPCLFYGSKEKSRRILLVLLLLIICTTL
jgi:hypothetical protein